MNRRLDASHEQRRWSPSPEFLALPVDDFDFCKKYGCLNFVLLFDAAAAATEGEYTDERLWPRARAAAPPPAPPAAPAAKPTAAALAALREQLGLKRR